jgi:hypothetical protein
MDCGNRFFGTCIRPPKSPPGTWVCANQVQQQQGCTAVMQC